MIEENGENIKKEIDPNEQFIIDKTKKTIFRFIISRKVIYENLVEDMVMTFANESLLNQHIHELKSIMGTDETTQAHSIR